MKWYRELGTAFLVIISLQLFGQKSNNFLKSSYIIPYNLEVTYSKTTQIAFPSAITSIDLGSKDIIVDKAVGVENILKVKANTKNFEETNLSVITNDGNLYSFLVNYTNNPSYLNIRLNNADAKTSPQVDASPVLSSEESIARYASKSFITRRNIHGVSDEAAQMVLRLDGFYVKENIMFCRLTFRNYSNINYDVDQFRIYIRDQKRAKRTATQEIEIYPLYILGDTSTIRGKTKENWVIAVPKFTIPDKKTLFIEIMERNGGRHLELRVKNRHVVKAQTL